MSGRPWTCAGRGYDIQALSVGGNKTTAHYGDLAALAPTILEQVEPPKYNRRKERDQYFCHWDPLHRYDGSRWNDENVSRAYLREARSFLTILSDLQLNGDPP